MPNVKIVNTQKEKRMAASPTRRLTTQVFVHVLIIVGLVLNDLDARILSPLPSPSRYWNSTFFTADF